MSFVGVDHVGFTVSDLDRSIAFYELLLERPPVARKRWDVPYIGRIAGYPGLKLEAAFFELPGGLTLELIEYEHPVPGRVDMETYNAGNAHLSLVSDDLHADFERLRDVARFRSPDPVTVEWGPHRGALAARLRDPDGITVELIQLAPDGVTFE
jgi:catechol 2,3-dioxygenase-like lactoylglutathione lyase family enzyme